MPHRRTAAEGVQRPTAGHGVGPAHHRLVRPRARLGRRGASGERVWQSGVAIAAAVEAWADPAGQTQRQQRTLGAAASALACAQQRLRGGGMHALRRGRALKAECVLAVVMTRIAGTRGARQPDGFERAQTGHREARARLLVRPSRSTRLCLSLRPLQTGQTRASPSPPVVTMASGSAAGTRVRSAAAALDILGRALETEGLAGPICF